MAWIVVYPADGGLDYAVIEDKDEAVAFGEDHAPYVITQIAGDAPLITRLLVLTPEQEAELGKRLDEGRNT